MFCCLRNCLGDAFATQTVTVRPRENLIHLDTTHMGHEVVIVKNGQRVCGSGGVLATAPLVQSKSYFEVKVQQSGHWSVGLATRNTDLNRPRGGLDAESWCLGSDNIIWHGDQEVYRLQEKPPEAEPKEVETGSLPAEGDTIGVAFDHVELNFYLNGRNLEVPMLNVRGTVYPALFVDDGAVLDILLDNFSHAPPPGFEKIMLEQSLL
ncbi:SPRY domain-containing protein 7 [Phlebotomus argentipes]|uniref:SPRY domain-containing protein 7 n=1 Tax=Phlebotomus argentipes TaxID=94469 RepID=UPI002892AEBF|nr:SPRY domain-containing protein 7 [Phlebotomus argentipes]